MGHTRIGLIPKSQKWEKILKLLSAEAESDTLQTDHFNATELANASLLAAEKGLSESINDDGVITALSTVVNILSAIALDSPLEDNTFQLSQVENARHFAFLINSLIRKNSASIDTISDRAEIAQRAISQSILELTRQTQGSLLNDSKPDELVRIKKLATKEGFAKFGQEFFSRYTYLYTNFFLSRISSYSVGNERIPDIFRLTDFNRAAQKHWAESARIVKDFSGTWFAKTTFYTKEITNKNIRNFLAIAFRKMRSEANYQRGILQ